MKFVVAAAVGAFASLASAQMSSMSIPGHWQGGAAPSVWCTDQPEKTVTVTVTASCPAGGQGAVASAPTTPPAGPPPAAPSPAGPAASRPMSTTVMTNGGTVTSVAYSISTTSTSLTAAGTYANPYGTDSITVGKATWATVTMPVSTVWEYPVGGATQTATKAVYGYNNKPYGNPEIVIIVVVSQGQSASTSYSTQTNQAGSTPSPPPPMAPPSSNPSATGSATGPVQTFHVDVVTSGGVNQYVPNQLNANVGDVLMFNFLAKNHTLTQSTLQTPCTPLSGGFDTGFHQANPNNQSGLFVIPFTVKTTAPTWFGCQQGAGTPAAHCPGGMVFGLNPAGKMDQFITNAKAQAVSAPASSGAPSSVAISVSSAPPASSTPPSTSTTTSSSATSGATNAIVTVTVGEGDGASLVFDPPFLTGIGQGSRVHFDFRAKNHTLTESSFNNPCTKVTGSGDIDTNFGNANAGDVPNLKPFDLTFDSDRPRYFYCKQGAGTAQAHCGKGMVFAVNVDQATFTQYQQKAEATLPKRGISFEG